MIRPPLYQEGQPVQVRDNNGRWVNATISRVESHYRYAISFPPEKRFPGGEIPGIGAAFEENDGRYGIRSRPKDD